MASNCCSELQARLDACEQREKALHLQIAQLEAENQKLKQAAAAIHASVAASAVAAPAAEQTSSSTEPPAAAAVSPSPSPAAPLPVSRIRVATARDVAAMDAMIRELAEFERAPEAVVGTAQMLHDALFGPNPRLHAHVVELQEDGGAAASLSATGDAADNVFTPESGWRIVGMAIWFETYSTWLARHGIWLEDLYVRPNCRGAGLGRALLRTLAQECVSRGYQRFDWYALDWNEPAHKAYRAIGAAPLDEWSMWRLEGDKLVQFAQTGKSVTAAASAGVSQ